MTLKKRELNSYNKFSREEREKKIEDGYSEDEIRQLEAENARKQGYKILSVLDDIDSKNIQEIKISKLKDYPNHFFKLYEGDRLEEMKKSVETNGVLNPLLVWKKDGEYTILSGHNRKHAAQQIGLKFVPCIVKENLSEDEADLIVTETNFLQRSFSELTYSEKALSLAQRNNALKKQGKRRDLTETFEGVSSSTLISDDVLTNDKLANEFNLSPRNVARYVKVGSLVTSLLELLDNGIISFIGAYHIAFVEDQNFQKELARVLNEQSRFPNFPIYKAEAVRKAYEQGELTMDKISTIVNHTASKPQSKLKKIEVSKKTLSKYFDESTPLDEVQDTVDLALKLYFSVSKKPK